MLVLTRRVDESIAVGDNIVITVLGIEGDRVKIGISAPRDIPILRHEVFEAVKGQAILQSRLAENPAPGTFDQLRKLLEEDADRADADRADADRADEDKAQP